MRKTPTPRKRKKTPKPSSFGEVAYSRLKQAIQDGVFKPGEPIRESRVADWLKVSRTPVRDAIRRLQSEGLLSYRLHDGVVVATLDRQDVINLYAVREVLEGAAAGMAARHASEVEIGALRAILRAAGNTKDPVLIAEQNFRFHALIHQTARNPYLIRTINTFRESLALLGPPTTVVPGRPKAVDKAHAEIFAAIEKHDAKAAEDAMRAHIRSALLSRFELLEHPDSALSQAVKYPMAGKLKSG